MDPIAASYPKRILVAVTGLSPQVVTETLYALTCANALPNQAPFIPTEVHVLTTAIGKELIQRQLLDKNNGQFYALLNDYPHLGRPTFTEKQIHLIRSPDGTPLADIRTPQDNTYAADGIIALMHLLTQDPKTILHVSIAGGRKTMGFYLGYAFSLFAREQDSLSHVLVSPPFENHPEFYFPPKQAQFLTTREGLRINTADADIALASIPVVRLREPYIEKYLSQNNTYSTLVNAYQSTVATPRLQINLHKKTVICGGIPVQLPSSLLAWYAWWAENHIKGQSLQYWGDANLDRYLQIYRRVVGQDAKAYQKLKQRINGDPSDHKSLFQENNAKLNKQLKNQLLARSDPYLIGKAVKAYCIGNTRVTGHQLVLAPACIELQIGS